MKWIMSDGGPLILMEARLQMQWGGTSGICVRDESATSDYERTYFPKDYLRAIPLAVGSALVLPGGPMDTAVWMLPMGTTVVVQVDCAETGDNIEELLARGWGQSEPISTTEFEVHTSNLVIFDSACAGDEAANGLTFSLTPGLYRISTERVAEHVQPQRGTCLILHRFDRI